jgi:hypothetical protein
MAKRSKSGQAALPFPKTPRRRRRGRPRIHARGDERHCKRPRITRHQPVLVTLKTVEGVKYLRNRHTCSALRKALHVSFRRGDFRICQISVQTGHFHLIVEADNYLALARGMQSFQISAAQQLNKIFSRRNGFRCRGQVFADRYHARVQRSPRQMRNSLRYVLGNWRRHGEDRGLGWRVDPYSSAPGFDGFAPRSGASRDGPSDEALLPVTLPHSWLLSVGWRRHGLLSSADRPGAASR